MIDESERTTLIDFGNAMLAKNASYHDNIGTPDYISPEMIDDSKTYDGLPAAIYSLTVNYGVATLV